MDAKTLFMRTLAEPNDIFLQSKGFFFFFSFFFFSNTTLLNIHSSVQLTFTKDNLQQNENYNLKLTKKKPTTIKT